MKEVLKKYENNCFPIDIEGIVSDFGLSIDYFAFDKINGFISGNSIIVNKSLSLAEQRFTIAHELGHFVDGELGASTELFSSTDSKEKIADQFAMDLLCPTYKVKEIWEEFENLPTVAQFLNVTENVMEKKLKQIL